MTTESLCTINNNNNSNNRTGQKQDQQQQQQQQKEQKQTIGGITEAFKTSREEEAVTSSATTTTSKVLLSEAQISTKTNNTKCYIETLKNQDIDEKEEGKNRNFKEKSPFIDSRSILTNKENLKRFWERKMEMDIKLRQQQELSCKPKVVSFDNNNNNSSATSNNEECKTSKEQQQQQQAASDEEWRSLSPNEEPSRFDLNNKQQNLNGSNKLVSYKKENTKQQQQVSAKLICEKLRDYQANDGEGALAKRRAENHERLGITAKNARHLKDKQPKENRQLLNSKNYNEEKKERQNTRDKQDDRCENYVPKSANGHNDEIQLMSIDPTLCHSSESINNNSNTDISDSNINNNNNNNSDNNDDNNTSYIKQIESATKFANEGIMNESITNEQTEEQTVNEEFSSSNSSFGPMSMSMSMPRQEDLCLSNVSNDLSTVLSHDSNLVETDTEDEPNSTQSGSVLTVITKINQNNRNNDDSNNQNNLSPPLNDNTQKSLSWNGSSIDQNTLTSEINEEEEERENEDDEEEEEESGSNIGVAFESLHFDNDIKSSKQEQVDDELLIAPPAPIPVRRPTVQSKFNASEVRSVCNFISAAISDATKQVENYMNLGNSNNSIPSNSRKEATQVIKDARDINDNYVVNNDDVDSDVNVNVNEQQDGDYEESSQNNSSSSIQRATFVRESQEFHTTTSDSDHLSPNEDQELIDIETQGGSKTAVMSETIPIISHLEDKEEEEGNEEEEQEETECVDETIPAADLSSIFEANVRREIERFETNSNIKKSNGGKYANKNSLTEWRIAEEIRLFNAREMELKKRFEDSSRSSFGDTNTNNANNNNNNNNSGGLNQQFTDHLKRQNQQHEAIVRFGKTLQLPKVSNMDPSSSSTSSSTSTSMSNLSKSIKLSTTATSTNSSSGQQQQQQQQQHQQTTMISMHKFIASGGKRFVFTNTNSSQNNNTTTLQNNLFTKSMSNLSTTTSGINKQRDETLQRVVDYKAVDSLKCKETPNVKPGIARKVIESFSRMQISQDSSSNHRVNDQAQQNNVITRQYLQQQQQQQPQHLQQQVSSSSSSSCLSNSAEWKIQEELREMRAREAELRDQRSQMLVNSSLQISHSNNQDELSPNGLCNGEDPGLHLNIISSDSGGHEMTTSCDELKKESSEGSLSFSSECLYPIKQTIDSFRKLNSSSQQASVSTNNFAQLTSHQNINNNNNNNYYSASKVQKKIIQTTGRINQQQNVSPDDYDSKVGGQRRKISMIEKWENKMY